MMTENESPKEIDIKNREIAGIAKACEGGDELRTDIEHSLHPPISSLANHLQYEVNNTHQPLHSTSA